MKTLFNLIATFILVSIVFAPASAGVSTDTDQDIIGASAESSDSDFLVNFDGEIVRFSEPATSTNILNSSQSAPKRSDLKVFVNNSLQDNHDFSI